MSADPEPVHDEDGDQDADEDRGATPQVEWRVTAEVDSRLEADLVVHLLRGHGVDAHAVPRGDGTADIIVPETAAEIARTTLDVR